MMKPLTTPVGIFLLALSSFSHAAEDAIVSEEAIENITDNINESILTIWNDFLNHIPYMVGGIVVLFVVWLVSRLLENVLRRMLKNSNIRGSLQDLVLRLFNIVVWIFGLLFSAMVVFPGLTPAKALSALGLVSIAVGFAFKDIFENFFAGILLLWRYPFEKGDFIECEGITGKIEDINIRMTKIRLTSGELVVVPNSLLFKNPVNVLTDTEYRRMSIVTGVAYDEDVPASVDVIEQAVADCETVNTDKPIQVYPQAFGASSIDIEVTWWTESEPGDHRKSRAEVVTRIKAALDEAGIEIPFPYRTLTFKQKLPIENVDAA